MESIDVIMCLKDPQPEIARLTLQRLHQQPEIHRLILVISKKSTLHTLDVLGHCQGAWVQVEFEDTSLAYARWRGIQLSTTPLISFLDHDVLLPKQYYRRLSRLLAKNPQLGAVQGCSMDLGLPAHGVRHKPPPRIVVRERGLCEAVLLRRELVTDWRPPLNLNALEDYHLTQHIKTKGYAWLEVPVYLNHLSSKEDAKYRELWNGAGFRMIQQLGQNSNAYAAREGFTSHPKFFLRRLYRLLTMPLFYWRYGVNPRAFLFEFRRQVNQLRGYCQPHKYLISPRRGIK